MKTTNQFLTLAVLFLFGFEALAQDFPTITEQDRITRLESPQGKVRMVLDTDTYNEIDDQFAVVYALLSKEKFDVEALYAAPYFNNRSISPEDGMEKSYEEILRLLDRLDMDHEGFVFKGSKEYLTDLSNPPESPAARDLIKRAKSASPENPLYVVAVGAITNVSSAIRMDPSIIENIVVVWLGGNSVHWPSSREFNFSQDLNASRLIFDCGVPLVQMPCVPVVTHLATTVPEMETYLKGRGAIGDYLLEIFKDYQKDHYAWSKVLWDMTAVAWLVNADWTPTNLIHSPIVTDQHTFSQDDSRHMIRAAYFINRDAIFGDFFRKIEAAAK
jgi:purine nucleosidase